MSLKTMNYVEPDNTPTEEQIAQSIPSGGGHNYTRLPEGVVPFEPATFFKQHQSEEKAICEMLVLPFGVDEQSLKMLPPAYTELDYLGKGHWQLDYFVTHAYANTDKGRRTFACPQSVGAQVEGTCPMCDKRVELLRAIKDKCGKWDPTQIPEEFGKQKAFGAFLAFVNNTDKVYYVEERTAFRYKNAKGKDATSDTKTTLFSILKDNQLLGNVTKRFWAMSSSPMWLRISWKYTKFPRNDGSTGFFWEVTGMKSVETSLTGIKAA
ncbi:MAG: hypothetical protein FWH21_00940, partial [Kiritimatiellaeota bacterium]|nr:hypothetical protein [Kiritimatiellota bacterium]